MLRFLNDCVALERLEIYRHVSLIKSKAELIYRIFMGTHRTYAEYNPDLIDASLEEFMVARAYFIIVLKIDMLRTEVLGEKAVSNHVLYRHT